MNKEQGFAFEKINYQLLIAGIVLVIVGFVLMGGGGSDNPDVFNGEELFSARRITVAPITVLLGYLVIFFAIMKKGKS